MLKRDEFTNPDSCLNRASIDEPIFVLRANDETAPLIVRLWANAYAESKGGWTNMTPEQKRKHAEAVDLANAMHRYKNAST